MSTIIEAEAGKPPFKKNHANITKKHGTGGYKNHFKKIVFHKINILINLNRFIILKFTENDIYQVMRQ